MMDAGVSGRALPGRPRSVGTAAEPAYSDDIVMAIWIAICYRPDMAPSDTSALYARISPQTKASVLSFGDRQGLTLAAAVEHLLEVGLATESHHATEATFRREVETLQEQLSETERDRDRETSRRERAEVELMGLQRAAGVWSDRAQIIVGICPGCGQALTGGDLLVAGRCRHCGRSAAELLAPPKNSGLDDKELMMVLGAAGLLLGVIAIASKG